MLGTLIESRAVHQRHNGSSLASILIHGVIITAGVMATAKDAVTALPEAPVVRPVPFVRQVDPSPTAVARGAQVSSAAIAPAPVPVLQRLDVPTIVPVGIPAADPTAWPTPADFGHGAITTEGILCTRDCATTTVGDSAGRALWTSRDVMMRLLEDPVPPRYPEALRRAGVEGEVVVRFVVDTTGRVDLRTIEVMRSTHGAFTDAVRETLAKLRFAPGAAGERKVRALAMMPFHFTLK